MDCKLRKERGRTNVGRGGGGGGGRVWGKGGTSWFEKSGLWLGASTVDDLCKAHTHEHAKIYVLIFCEQRLHKVNKLQTKRL